MEEKAESKPSAIRALLQAAGGKLGIRRAKRAVLNESFTRLLAHKPIGWGAVGEPGKRWRRSMDAWIARVAEARQGTYRRDRTVR